MKRTVAIAAIFFLSSLLLLSSFAPSLTAANQKRSPTFVPLVQVGPEVSVTAGANPCPPTLLVHCYVPNDILAAYGVDKLHAEGITGKGETIVIVDSYGSPTALQDLQNFSTTFGLPKPDLTIVYPTGTPTFSPSMFGVQAGWAFETSLDLQWAHTIAPDAKLVLIAANPAETEGVQGFPSIFIGEQYAIEHYPGSVISQSFAVTEQSFEAAGPQIVSLFDQVYQLAVQNNVTVVSAAGDSGTSNIVGGQGVSPVKLVPYQTVQWPASDPLVTAAGGTWLQYGWTWDPTISNTTFYSCLASGGTTCYSEYLNSKVTPGSRTEAVWREDWLPAATGGGRSFLFTTPSFQIGISSSILEGRRGIPDLSWNAAVDGGVLVHVSFPGIKPGFYIVGGTSAATPQIAGLIALTNQLADSLHKPHVGYLNPLLYKLPSRDFNDIVPVTFGVGQGVVNLNTNGEYGTGIPGFRVSTGWDLASGFGSPNAYYFVHDLAEELP
jgi:subtilase family serine protease